MENMPKQKIKNDKFKIAVIPHKGVRSPHTSVETPVMGAERRGRQNSRHVLNSHSGIIARRSGKRSEKGAFCYDHWMRISLGVCLPLQTNKETLRRDIGKSNESGNTEGVDRIEQRCTDIRRRILRSRVREIRMHGSARVLPNVNGGRG